MFNNWIKQSEEKFCLMEISRSNEVKYLKIGSTRALNCIAAVGGKKDKTNYHRLVSCLLMYICNRPPFILSDSLEFIYFKTSVDRNQLNIIFVKSHYSVINLNLRVLGSG